ncbi:MAG: DNRLRE domain-containing protein [Planctomycetia bacterium]|nr:DNRLRE domain-containing protein [Planctomycetia bacterium]
MDGMNGWPAGITPGAGRHGAGAREASGAWHRGRRGGLTLLWRIATAAATAVTVARSPVPAAGQLVVTTSTATFQQGVGGYTGATNRVLTSAAASAGTSASIDMAGGDLESQYFLKFDSLFGGSAVPVGATILDARLKVTTTGASNAQSAGNFSVSGLTAAFTGGTNLQTAFPGVVAGGTATATAQTLGPLYSNGYSTLPSGAVKAPALNSAQTFDVTAVAERWAAGTLANNGLAIQSHTTDGWNINTITGATAANRPQLSIAYTTAPTTTAAVKSGMTVVTLQAPSINGTQTNTVADRSNAPTVAVDGPTGNAPPGDGSSPDLLALVNVGPVIGSGAAQIPVRAQVLKSWFIVTTGEASNDESNGSYGLYRMKSDWSTASTYTGFGEGGPVAGIDYEQNATAQSVVTPKNTQVRFDVTADVKAWQQGAAEKGFMIRAAGTTDGWTFGGPGNTDPNRQPEFRTIYAVDGLRWRGGQSATWDKGTGIDVGGTRNFALESTGTATNFIDTDRVTFDDSATGTGAIGVTVAAAVAPQRLVFAGATRAVTLSGPGSIGGAGTMTVSGAGGVILDIDAAPGGGTRVDAGRLQIGTGGTTGSLGGAVTVAAGATLEFNRDGRLVVPGALAGAGALVKSGPGRVDLTRPATLAGPITVSGGTLAMAATTASGGVTVGNGSALVATSGATPTTFSTPTLALGALGSTLGFELAAAGNPTVPLLSVTQADGLNLAGATHHLALRTSGALGVGRFTLVDYAGAPVTSGFTLAALPQRLAGTLVYDTSATTIDLDITGIDVVRWRGGASGQWDAGSEVDVGGTPNWALVSSDATTNFVAGDQLRFDDSAATRSVELVGTLAPGAITVDAAGDYVFGGAGAIGGAGALTKLGGGRLTLAVANGSAGATTVDQGVLQVGSGATPGSLAGAAVVNPAGTLELVAGTLGGPVTVAGGVFAASGGTVNGPLTVGGGMATFTGGRLAAAATVTDGTLNLGGGGALGPSHAFPIAVAAPGRLVFDHTDAVDLSGILSGAGAITKAGAGRLTVLASNTAFTGTLVIDGGEVRIDDQGAGGDFNATSILVNSGATFQFGNNTVGNPDLPETGAGACYVTANAGGTVIWQEGESIGGLNLNGGLVDLQLGGITSFGPVAQQWTAGRLTASAGLANSVGGSTAIVKTGPGEVLVDGLASVTSTGGLSVAEGTVRFATATNLGGSNVLLGLGGAATSGTIVYGGATVSRGGAIVTGSGGGALAVADPSAVLTFTGSLGGAGALTKLGPGGLTLTQAATLPGGLTIAEGAVTLPASTVGPLRLMDGTRMTVASGQGATPFTATRLDLDPGTAEISFQITAAGNPGGPLLSVGGPVTIGDGTHGLRLTTTGVWAPGRFTLIDYDGPAITSGFTLAAPLQQRAAGMLVYDTLGTRVDLEITGVDVVKWRGGVSNVWDVGSDIDVGGTPNWVVDSGGEPATNFVAGDQVRFDDSATGRDVVLTEIVSPGAVTVDAAGDYTFSGPGGLAGIGGLAKLGTGRIVFTTANTSTGLTNVTGGVLQVGDGAAPGSIAGPSAASGGGVLELRGGSVGAVAVDGDGLFRTLGGTAAGPLTVGDRGTARIEGGVLSGSSTVLPGGTLEAVAGRVTGRVTVAGGQATFAGADLAAGATVSSGILRLGTGGPAGAVAGPLAVATGGTIAVNLSTDLLYTGTLSGAGLLTKAGDARMTLVASNTGFTGTVVIDKGELRIEDPGTAGTGGDLNATSIVVNDGGTFQFGNNDVGNPDLPNSTIITLNAGGRAVFQEAEDFGGVGLAGGTLDLQAGAIASGTLTVNFQAASPQVWSAGRVTASTGAAGLIGGTAAIVKTDTGTVVVDGAARIVNTGGVRIEQGTLALASDVNLGTAALTLGGATTAGVLEYRGGTAGRGGAVTLAAGGGTVAVTDAGATLTLSGSIGGAGALAKAGPGTLVLSNAANALSGRVTVSGGTLRAGSAGALGTGTVVVGAGGTFDANGQALGNAIEAQGGGLIGLAAYAGTLTVADSVRLDGQVGGTVNVVAGGVLRGVGSQFGGAVTIAAGGVHDPGASPGVQQFIAGLSYQAGSTLRWELVDNTVAGRGTAFDGVDVTGGGLTIADGALLQLVFDGAGSTVSWTDAFWVSDHVWRIVDGDAAASSVGLFTLAAVGVDAFGKSLAEIRPGAGFAVIRDGANVSLQFQVTPVPEPGALALAAVGGTTALVAALRRRKRVRRG